MAQGENASEALGSSPSNAKNKGKIFFFILISLFLYTERYTFENVYPLAE